MGTRRPPRLLWGAVIAALALVLSGGLAPESRAQAERRFSMEFRDADVRDVLRALGQQNRLNVLFGDEVQGKITLSFRDVTLRDALEAILRIQNLSGIQEGNILRIVRSPIAAGEEHLGLAIIPVQYSDATAISTSVQQLLSSRGKLTLDARTNTLIVRDVEENIKRIRRVIGELDHRTPQVLIEAKIVEADANFAKEIGIQWGANFLDRSNLGTFGIGGTNTGGIGGSGNTFLVNLPATVAPGSGGGIGFSFGNISDTFTLDLQLSALQNSGRGKILSSPRILTQNNKEAKISTGLSIPVLTSTIAGGGQTETGVENIDVDLKMTVTPHVTPGDEINLKILVEKKDADFSRTRDGLPTLTTREASTELIARDGQTIVIGGMYQKSESFQRDGLPFLSDLPFVGWLFKREETIDNQTELLIFVTPRLYREEGPVTSSFLPSP